MFFIVGTFIYVFILVICRFIMVCKFLLVFSGILITCYGYRRMKIGKIVLFAGTAITSAFVYTKLN